MEKGKSPGVDAIPIEFYEEIFEILKKDLQTVFNNVLFELKKTPKTWNHAIICLILKRKHKLEYLKYWRPISLLCAEYKIQLIFNERPNKIFKRKENSILDITN